MAYRFSQNVITAVNTMCEKHRDITFPLSSSALNTQAIREAALEKLRQVDTDTVFLTWIDCFFSDDRSEEISLFRNNIEFFENAGLEVGVWIRSFGYGPPAGKRAIEATRNITRIKSVVGNQMDTMDAMCPECDDFMAFFRHFIADLMQARPKMIMLDDDMCLSVRPGIGCFCDRHMELLSQKLGEDLTGKPLEKLMFTGGRNRYRDACEPDQLFRGFAALIITRESISSVKRVMARWQFFSKICMKTNCLTL